MKELKTYNKYFLKGSSLIESVIAISIIATCLLVAIRLYAAVLNSSSSLSSYKIKFKVAELYNDAKITSDFDDELYEFETYSIQKKVEDFQSKKELKNVKYIVRTASDTIVYNYLLANKKSNE
ncbi:hypothetical protein D1818_25085 [Aquimarina sp. BL5]|uniref:hypothetical protein n=1 Tax=Aquimarina sp. BL5 TaxID=1714860 RepID=UPI000E4A7950|nr:hypothetical protein [Aquimarina sp. BL5]AXT53927.1 hypothetical protein D1818_25085 [Aquimarina sp. BL5]RKN05766.1 hypothetical protein D7036_10100 [Aquimarina sp. BL5]